MKQHLFQNRTEPEKEIDVFSAVQSSSFKGALSEPPTL